MKRNNKFKIPVRLVVYAIIILLALFFIMGYIYRVMHTSEYFKVTEIITKTPTNVDVSYLKGRNIFTIDLQKESDYLLQYLPVFKKVKMAKVLPNRIFVDFIKRNPVALVKLYKYFLVDENGVFFYSPDNEQSSDLPVITGLETRVFGAKPGVKYNCQELSLALNVIRGMKENKILREFKIKKIDVINSSSASIFLILPPNSSRYSSGKQDIVPEYLEVKIGQGNIKDKIVFLVGLIVDENKDLSNIKYIDLRFKEPVIRPKDAKKIP